MPIPKKTMTENPKEFIGRCMADTKMNSEYPDQSQRFAVCIGQLTDSEVAEFDRLNQQNSDGRN
jgi:hypothetical protein